MKKLSTFVCAGLLVSACASTPSPASEGRTIVVDGEATIRIMPDTFSVSGRLLTRNPDQAAGLAELSSQLEKVKRTLPQLSELKHIQIESSEMQLGPIYDPTCMREQGYRDDTIMCPVVARMGTVGLTVKGSPADRAGQLVSLLSELGAETVELNSFSISDEKPGKDKALSAAVEDARAKAFAIANAAGATITGLERVQYGGGFSTERYGGAFSLTAVWEQDLQPQAVILPTIDLDIDPSPIELNAKVVVAFGVQ